jgi:glycosyltransferase involved in cell wall biosynthesis
LNTLHSSQNLIFVINRLAGGGAETQTRRLSIGFAKRGWRVTVVSLQADVIETPDLDEHEVRRVNLAGPRGFRSVRVLPALVRLLRREAPDIVVAMMIPADPLTRVAGRIAGVPVVSSIRNHFVGGRGVNALLRLTDRFPTLITANARVTRDELGPRICARPEGIELVPNALDADAFQRGDGVGEAVRARMEIPPNAFLWLAVGAQRPQKDYKNLLRVFAGLPQESALAIAGAPYQQEALSALVDELGIAHRIWFLGRRDDVPDLLAACDAFVQASLHEGTPNAVLEAMAARRPVVATAVGGVPDTIVHGESGWLVPKADYGALRNQMIEVMRSDKTLRARVAAKACENVVRDHSTQAVIAAWERIFLGIISRKAAK